MICFVGTDIGYLFDRCLIDVRPIDRRFDNKKKKKAAITDNAFAEIDERSTLYSAYRSRQSKKRDDVRRVYTALT